MTLRQRLLSLLSRESDGSPSTTPARYAPREGVVELFAPTPAGGMSVAAVYRCVKLLSESVASLPVQYLKRGRTGLYAPAGDEPMDWLLNMEPSPSVNAFDFWRRTVQDILIDGNAYIVPVYHPVTMTVDRLVLCPAGTVSHDTVADTYRIGYPAEGISGTYAESEVIHIKGLTGADPKRGVGVVSHARLTMDIAVTGDRETRSRFANGGTMRGIITNDKAVRGFGEYADEELARLADRFDVGFRGDSRFISVPGDVDVKTVSLSSTDMQFLESRKFTVREICRFFGVHPSFVFDDTSNNYKSAEQANVAFLSHTLNPLLRSIETELNRKLLGRARSGRYTIRFDRRALHACDFDGMAAHRAAMLQTGATVNEVRRMDDLPPVEGGDTPLISANLRTVAEVTAPTPIPNL